MLEGAPAALSPLHQEAGGHRWQRVPPGDRKQRVHSSTVTVSVYAPREVRAFKLDPGDIDMRFTRDRGPGGQHKNKTESCVVLTHRPSGTTVKVDGRDQHANRRQALQELERRVASAQREADRQGLAELVAAQVGSGQRGDKVRTYRVQDGRATDHRTGATADLRHLRSGHLDALWALANS